MGWSLGYDSKWGRDIGYGVVAYCDHPTCNEEIDRGLSYVCAGEHPRGGDGCGLYFCSKHLSSYRESLGRCCKRCGGSKPPYKHPKPEHPLWIRFKMLDPSWEDWREECPDELKEFTDAWNKLSPEVQADAEKRALEEIEGLPFETNIGYSPRNV